MSDNFKRYISSTFDLDEKLDTANKWYREKANEIVKLDTRSVIRQNIDLAVSRVRLGRMYLYQYDPVGKNELPYYDRFPVVFVIDVQRNGFLGLNLHYLPFKYRATLMDALYEFTIGEEDNRRLRATYKILSSVKSLRFFKPCLKQYLNSQMRSRFLLVPPSEWDTALFLPLQSFIKAKEPVVYKDSIRKIRTRV